MALKLVCGLLLCMLVVQPMGSWGITCGDVTKNLSPCLPYLQKGGALPPRCCPGVKAINGMANNTPNRQAVCRCLQTAAKAMTGLNQNFVQGLPGKCGVNIPYKISPTTNCNSVK